MFLIFRHISYKYIQRYLNSLSYKYWNRILGKGMMLLTLSRRVISKSLARAIKSSSDCGIVHGGRKNAWVTPVYWNEGEIHAENNLGSISVINHIAQEH